MAKHIHIHVGKKTTDQSFEPGDKVHLGFGAVGGAGVFGILLKIENGVAFIKNDEGRTFKGPISKLSSGSKKTKDKDFSRYIIGARGQINEAMNAVAYIINGNDSPKEISAARKSLELLSQAKKELQVLG